MHQLLRVLLVEDDWTVRSAVHDYLSRRQMEVAEADCAETALRVADQHQPDVAVIDIVMPEKAGQRPDFDSHVGIEVARELRKRFPEMGVVFLSAYVDRGPEVIQLFMDGHNRIAYLLKGSRPQELLDAIHRVAHGASALEIATGVRTARDGAFDLALGSLTAEEQAAISAALDGLTALSEPEWRVFEAVGRCRTRQQAAGELGVSVKTVASHIDAIYSKLALRQIHPGLNQLALLAKLHLLNHLRTEGGAPHGAKQATRR
jgi:DNA-binding NarL/FixJ family response regulator